MKRRLFLTGPMGAGKSTAIGEALGEKLAGCGGFRTRRTRDKYGHAVTFFLESPDGAVRETFLDFSQGKPRVRLEVFESLGRTLLGGKMPCVLDEIGGVDLLCPGFMEALEDLLRKDVPVIGVIKGEGPAGALIQALGLSEEYAQAADRLRQMLREDGDTLLYECGQFDKNALALARQWAEEYLHE